MHTICGEAAAAVGQLVLVGFLEEVMALTFNYVIGRIRDLSQQGCKLAFSNARFIETGISFVKSKVKSDAFEIFECV